MISIHISPISVPSTVMWESNCGEGDTKPVNVDSTMDAPIKGMDNDCNRDPPPTISIRTAFGAITIRMVGSAHPTYRLIAPYNYRRAAPPERVGDRESRDSEIAPTDKTKKTIVNRLVRSRTGNRRFDAQGLHPIRSHYHKDGGQCPPYI